MTDKMTPAEAMTAQLAAIPVGLRPDPAQYALMQRVAAKLDSAARASVIRQMLGVAGDWGVDPPPTKLSFPADHRLHLKNGDEWYWIGATFTADGPNGPAKIALLLSMERIRVLANAIQAEAGWTDEDAQVVWNAVTVVVADAKGAAITRRRTNVQWRPVGGRVEFPGDTFIYRCGPDALIGPPDVMPLQVFVDDGDHMRVDLTLSTDMPAASAFFLQGNAGITPVLPGIYYSWPQLAAAGQIRIGPITYEVTGKGWLDHQLMMAKVPDGPLPPATPGFDGWHWCEFNLDNGDAFTAAAFQVGPLRGSPFTPYGFYVRRQGDAWLAEPIAGVLAVDRFIPTLHDVLQPTSWNYAATNFPGAPPFAPLDLTIATAPWIDDGSFETANLCVPSEVPVSVAAINHAPGPNGAPQGQPLTGAGYCESVSLELPDLYMRRAMDFLRRSYDVG